MKIMVNGTPAEFVCEALPEVLHELGYGDERVATAVNERFVPAAARSGVTLFPGDRLEVVAPRQGG